MKVSRLRVIHPVSPLPGLDVDFSGVHSHFAAELAEGFVHVSDKRADSKLPRFAVPLANVAMLVLESEAQALKKAAK